MELLCLAVLLLSTPLLTLCDPLYVLSAPNLLRVGSSENVMVEAQDYSGADINVKIIVKKYPSKDRELLSKSVTLTAANNFQIVTDIQVVDKQNSFSEDPEEKQYVYLQAQFPTSLLEKIVMVSFQSGYIFVQTDKPIYTPASTVLYRIFVMTPNLQPFTQTGVTVEVVNPQGITVTSDKLYPDKGVKSGKYGLPEIASPGIWKVVTRFSNTPQKVFTADFEVKEYVLPTIEVTLKPSQTFFHVKDESLGVDIEAIYLFGKNVAGTAIVLFGVMTDDKKISIPSSLQKEELTKGKAVAELTRDMILDTFPNINQLIGSSIYVSVTVLTETGSEMVEVQRRNIHIVTSPYSIYFKKTPHYFKPGMPFDISVYVTNPDQTPAEGVEVEVNPGMSRGQTKANGIAKVTINTQGGKSSLEITAKTKDERFPENQQAVKMMTAKAYKPKDNSNNFLHIGIDAAELQIGDLMKVNLNTGQSSGAKDQDYTYMILSKGQIVKVDRFKRKDQSLVTLNVPVTKDMVPSFRFVAYYHVGKEEVVSDSVWVDVKDTCMGKLKLDVVDKNINTYNTGDEVKLEITGDPGAKVGLVVVDKAVQVLNKNRLTQGQIWDYIERNDTGCTAGGGSESMGVFYDAGLLFESNTAGGTIVRTDPLCPVTVKRRRRAESLLEITSNLARKYSGDVRKCCVDGMEEHMLGYSCERRATFIVSNVQGCVTAFLDCCKAITARRSETKDDQLYLARSEDDDDYYADSDEITSRTQFPESWLWEEVDLPICKTPKCATTSLIKDSVYLKDSITTWQFLAVSLSPTLGICVAEPKELVVFKKFFIDLKLPYSVVRGEQVEIRAIIHNYTPKDEDLKVRVEFMENKDVCSAASKKSKYRTTVTVPKDSSRSVSFVIIPMKLEDVLIEVKASGYDSVYTDGVRKTLKVVSEGVLVQLQQENLEINPTKQGEKPLLLKTEIPKDRVPGTQTSTIITMTGEEITQTVQQVISGKSLGTLIVQPHGCGEQNMYSMTLPVIATHYLDRTKQWEAVGMLRRKEAIEHINTGFQRQLNYRKADGSYAAWTERPSSTWLTAYVAKVFAMASKLTAIDETVLCSALKWLVMQRQLPDGSFEEKTRVIHGEMVGDVQGKDSDASLTAFVLIAMQESKDICSSTVASLPDSRRKAIVFLESRLPKLTNPYSVAMVSYAMANEDKLNKDLLMKHSSKSADGTFWNVPGQYYHSIEATSYALLALVKVKDFDSAGQVVHWLARQQTHYGGSGTTQSTIMVFQALAAYRTEVTNQENFNLDVELSLPGRSRPVKWTFRKDNRHVTRSDNIELNKNFNVTASGTGSATLSVLTLYYAQPVEKKSDCTKFDLTVRLVPEPERKKPGVLETYRLTMEFFYKVKEQKATMTILDIGLPTGFSVEVEDLTKLSSGVDQVLQKFEMNKNLTERGSLILYLDQVSNKETDQMSFRVHKMNNVSFLQPASVTIYEYYSPDARCTKYYHPEKEDGALSILCLGDVCQCAEEKCSVQKSEEIKEDLRAEKACEAGMDYVYKVRLMDKKLAMHSDIYSMTVEEVLKEGTDDGVEGKERQFIGRPACRKYFNLEIGKSYLIMGKSVDLPRVDDRLQYVLGEQTWIEYWPTREESQMEMYKARYLGITDLQNRLIKGCAT